MNKLISIVVALLLVFLGAYYYAMQMSINCDASVPDYCETMATSYAFGMTHKIAVYVFGNYAAYRVAESMWFKGILGCVVLNVFVAASYVAYFDCGTPATVLTLIAGFVGIGIISAVRPTWIKKSNAS